MTSHFTSENTYTWLLIITQSKYILINKNKYFEMLAIFCADVKNWKHCLLSIVRCYCILDSFFIWLLIHTTLANSENIVILNVCLFGNNLRMIKIQRDNLLEGGLSISPEKVSIHRQRISSWTECRIERHIYHAGNFCMWFLLGHCEPMSNDRSNLFGGIYYLTRGGKTSSFRFAEKARVCREGRTIRKITFALRENVIWKGI